VPLIARSDASPAAGLTFATRLALIIIAIIAIISGIIVCVGRGAKRVASADRPARRATPHRACPALGSRHRRRDICI
jgi:hypothetical protein